MINRLISSLPFNPSLLSELSIYARKLKNEQPVRRLGFILILLGLVVQFIAAGTPLQKSLAASDNDLVKGGLQTKQDIINAWVNPHNNLAEIYQRFGISKQDIQNLPDQPNATITSTESNYWSVGRSPLTSSSNTNQYQDQDIAIKTEGPIVYMQPLKAWDNNGQSTYKAFKGNKTSTGEAFWILANSGDYVQNGHGKLARPSLQIRSTVVGDNRYVKPGGTIKFRIEYRNMAEDSLAEDVNLIDNLQLDRYKILSPQDLNIDNSGKFTQPLDNLPYTDNGRIFDLVVRLKDNLKDGAAICNSVKLIASNATAVKPNRSSDNCITVGQVPPASRENDSVIPPALSKTVSNLTQHLNGQSALSSEVHPGDVLEYSLTTYNGRSKDMLGYDVRDYVGDVMDYADIDRDFLNQQVGIFNDSTKEIVWSHQTLKSGQDNIRRFRVKIKDPIPATSQPSNLSTNFDCKISNEYGNEATIPVQCPLIKTITTTPNIGPGSAFSIIFAIAAISGYFVARNGLLRKEVFVLRKNYTSSRSNSDG